MSSGELSNYQRLQKNKEKISADVSAYLSSPEPSRSLDNIKASAQRIVKSATGSFSPSGGSYEAAKDSYSAAIQSLNEARDARHGIAWHRSPDPHDDGTLTLVRDARSVTGANDIDSKSPESYVMNYLNLARAAEAMLDQAKEPDMDSAEISRIRDQTRAKAKKLMEALQDPSRRSSITPDTFVHLTDDLVSGLSSLKKRDGTSLYSDAKGTLDRAKALTALDDQHFHISTLSTQKDAEGKDRVVVESEVMALGTTEALREQFKAIAEGRNTSKIEWYNVLDEEKKKLVQKYATDLARGDKVVSSQLFNFIPGLKNAYMKVVEVSKTEGEGRDVVLESFHSGTPTYGGKGDKAKGTKETADLARTFVEPGEGVEVDFALQTLNSRGTGVLSLPNERNIVESLRKYQKSADNTKGTAVDESAVNIFRVISKSKHEFSRKTLEKFSNLLGHNTDLDYNPQGKDAIVSFLKNGETRPWYKVWQKKDKTKAKEALAELEDTNPELAKAVSSAMRLRESVDRSSGFLRRNNFRIATEALVVDHHLNSLGAKTQNRRLVFCKSGKDRTQSVEYKATHLAVSDHLGLTSAAKGKGPEAKEARESLKHNMLVLAGASSAQFMAGVQGGTVGAHGILPHLPKEVFDKSIRSSVNMGLKTSKSNKVKTRKKILGFIPVKARTEAARRIIEEATSVSAPSTTPGARGQRQDGQAI